MKKIVSEQPKKAITRIIPILCFSTEYVWNEKIYLIKTEIAAEKKKPSWEQKGL